MRLRIYIRYKIIAHDSFVHAADTFPAGAGWQSMMSHFAATIRELHELRECSGGVSESAHSAQSRYMSSLVFCTLTNAMLRLPSTCVCPYCNMRLTAFAVKMLTRKHVLNKGTTEGTTACAPQLRRGIAPRAFAAYFSAILKKWGIQTL